MMDARRHTSGWILELPQAALEAVMSRLGCAATSASARLAHPILCAAIDRQLPAITVNATSSHYQKARGLPLSQLPLLRFVGVK
jgi:hypothetical protein